MTPTVLAHINDSQVSHDAAINLSPVVSERVMQIIALTIDAQGPLTPTELERFYHRNAVFNGWPLVELRTVAKRASEMKTQLHVLEGTGVRRERAEALRLTADLTTVYATITEHWKTS